MTEKKKLLIIQTSLNKTGNTQKIVNYTKQEFDKLENFKTEILDLKETKIELCNGEKIEKYSSETQDLYKKIKSADCYILATPIYNNAISGVCKNFLDIFSKAMENKYVGLIENSGNTHAQGKAYNQLILIFEYHKIKLLEFYVFTNTRSFKNNELVDDLAKDELDKMKSELNKLQKNHKIQEAI